MSEKRGSVLLDHEHEAKWKALHEQMSDLDSKRLAGLFRGWVPEGFASNRWRVLYIGKATSGEFRGEEVERTSFNGEKAFWQFARQIAEAVGCPGPDLRCLAWSNISKISLSQVEADASLIDGYENVAVSSLEAEIVTTQPHIAVFVTSHFSDTVVRSIGHGHEDSSWNKSEAETHLPDLCDVWWRRRPDGVAVLWMRHPQFAKPQLLAYAAEKIRDLVTNLPTGA